MAGCTHLFLGPFHEALLFTQAGLLALGFMSYWLRLPIIKTVTYAVFVYLYSGGDRIRFSPLSKGLRISLVLCI